MPDAMSEDELKTLTEDMCLGGAGHFFTTFIYQREYVLITDANAVPGKANGDVVVNLGLKRLSDGLESKFMDIVSVDKLRIFIDIAKKNETIDYLKGKVLNAFYYNGEPIQVILNKYALPDK